MKGSAIHSRGGIVRTLLTVGLLCAAAVLLLDTFVGRFPRAERLKNEEARIAYLSELGWSVTERPVQTQEILLPEKFPDVLLEYNKLQCQQGFDLERYAGKKVTLYTYEIGNYPEEENVFASLYQYRNRLIGGDIHSTSFSGFMRALR